MLPSTPNAPSANQLALLQATFGATASQPAQAQINQSRSFGGLFPLAAAARKTAMGLNGTNNSPTGVLAQPQAAPMMRMSQPQAPATVDPRQALLSALLQQHIQSLPMMAAQGR